MKFINQIWEDMTGKSPTGPIKIINTKSVKRVMHFELVNHE